MASLAPQAHEAVADVGRTGSRLPRWRTIILIAATFLGWNALREWGEDHAFLINASDSLPNWALLVQKNVMPAKGEYIVFSPPETKLIERHFGVHPKPFAKFVYGVGGDLVDRQGGWVRVNGRPIAHLKAFSRQGEALTPGPVGRVPQRCYFVGTPHPDGFDSRYADIGFVCARQVVGTGVPVL